MDNNGVGGKTRTRKRPSKHCKKPETIARRLEQLPNSYNQ
jgi:hypothetical protein